MSWFPTLPQSFEFSEELKGLYMRWNILPPCNLFPFDSKKQFWKMWCHWLACTICSKASGGWYTNQHHWMFLNVPYSQNNWKTCFYCIALDYKKKNIPFLLQFLFFSFFLFFPSQKMSKMSLRGLACGKACCWMPGLRNRMLCSYLTPS